MILGQPIPEDATGGPLVARRFDTLRVLGQDIVQVPTDMFQQEPLIPAGACSAVVERESSLAERDAYQRSLVFGAGAIVVAFFAGRWLERRGR